MAALPPISEISPPSSANRFDHEIEQDVAVDQRHGHSLAARQRHNLIGTHCDIAAPAQMGNQTRASFILVDGRHRSHNLTVKLEIDLRTGQ
jgi:hypothetical protein